MPNWLLYDGDCPFCSSFARMLRFKAAAGPLELRNAREHIELAEEMRAKGFDVDKGMILSLGDQLYYDADCLQVLASMTSQVSVFNRINAAIFSNRRLSGVIYPFLKFCRAMTLAALGRKRIWNRGSTP